MLQFIKISYLKGECSMSKRKKPIIKRWWFWLIIILLIVGTFSPDQEEKEKTYEPKTEIAKEQDASMPTPTLPPDRGNCNSTGWSEPNYIGTSGYVSAYNEKSIKGNENFSSDKWMIPTYEKDKQFWNESGEVEHKTSVTVLDQELKHEGHGFYSGYLLVKTEEEKEYYIEIHNYVLDPYWELKSLYEMAQKGMYVAEFKQSSEYYPVFEYGEKVELDDGAVILVVGTTHFAKNTVKDAIEGIVYKQWEYGNGGVSVFFSPEDLTYIK